MKPSEMLKCTSYSPADIEILKVLDAMVEDIARLKFLVQYNCSSDLVKVYPIKEREYEK